jgi:hypothetical protein
MVPNNQNSLGYTDADFFLISPILTQTLKTIFTVLTSQQTSWHQRSASHSKCIPLKNCELPMFHALSYSMLPAGRFECL